MEISSNGTTTASDRGLVLIASIVPAADESLGRGRAATRPCTAKAVIGGKSLSREWHGQGSTPPPLGVTLTAHAPRYTEPVADSSDSN